MKEQIEELPKPEGPHAKWRQDVKREEWISTSMGDNPEDPGQIEQNREVMDARIKGLGEVMKDADFWWQLDGGMNISAQEGEYVRVHADIDISLKSEELEKAEEYLKERGYGFFVTYKRDREGEDGSRVFRRVGAADLLREDMLTGEEKDRHVSDRIAAIDDPTGKIRNDAGFVSADLAIVERDSDGHYRGRLGVVMPDEWMAGRRIEFKGVEINLSHPARFMFNKIIWDRPHDRRDIERYAKAGSITLTDLTELEPVLDELFSRTQSEIAQENDENKRNRIIRRIEYAKEMLGKLHEWVY